MTYKYYIVGGGITGLIWNFYNPEWKIITPNVGGQFSKKHLVLLHDTIETRKLMTDIGIKNPAQYSKNTRLGYYRDGWISDTQTENMNTLTIQKKMTEWNKPLNKALRIESREISTARVGSGSYLKILDVDLGEVIKKMQEKSNIQFGSVTQINPSTFTVDNKEEIEYTHLVTSVPAPMFWSMYTGYRPNIQFKSIPTTNVELRKKPDVFDDDYDLVYYDDSVPFSRISKIDNKYIVEFTGVLDLNVAQSILKTDIESIFTVRTGRIFNQLLNLSPQSNIIFSGRFGVWNYKLTAEHIIKQVIDYKYATR